MREITQEEINATPEPVRSVETSKRIEAKKPTPATQSDKVKVFGKYGACGVIRWLARQGFDVERVKRAFHSLSATLPSDGTIKVQIQGALKGRYGEPQEMNVDEQKQLLGVK
jgi:hypothetical protein